MHALDPITRNCEGASPEQREYQPVEPLYTPELGQRAYCESAPSFHAWGAAEGMDMRMVRRRRRRGQAAR